MRFRAEAHIKANDTYSQPQMSGLVEESIGIFEQNDKWAKEISFCSTPARREVFMRASIHCLEPLMVDQCIKSLWIVAIRKQSCKKKKPILSHALSVGKATERIIGY